MNSIVRVAKSSSIFLLLASLLIFAAFGLHPTAYADEMPSSSSSDSTPAIEQENPISPQALGGWSNDGNRWYYYSTSGSPASGWTKIYHSGQYDWYYFVNGVMQIGWLKWDGSWFYLADTTGQDVGFYDSEYGVCRYGWQEIYHNGFWDWYYFAGGGSGRMQTGWITSSNRTYYLQDESAGISFNHTLYGTMAVGLHDVGPYKYYFFNGNARDFDLSGKYRHGELVRNESWFGIFSDGYLVEYASADANGRVTLGGWDEPDPDSGIADATTEDSSVVVM